MFNYITRECSQKITNDFFKGKAVILVGPRQVGKTTLVKMLLANEKQDIVEFIADNPTDKAKLENQDFAQLDKLIGNKKYIFIDEAQRVVNIGITLKLLVDNYGSSKQVVVTGSSSLNLFTNTQEPLTGRKFVYELFGFSLRELFPEMNNLMIEKSLPNLLIFGSYPDVYLASQNEKQRLLIDITNSYLYKDILELEQVRNPHTLQKLLSALSLQVGSEVSLSELSSLVGLNVKTISRYIDLLEKNYVLFRLSPYYSNRRKTLAKQNKIYFYDLGVRNALINNFNPLELRNDVGALWENFLILERLKYRHINFLSANQFFWKTYDGAEIDLVEERQGKLYGYEFKWGKKRTAPKSWLSYSHAQYKEINKENFADFLK
jgi:uncharacterized protein